MYIYNMNCILYIIHVYIWHTKIQVKFSTLVLLGGALWFLISYINNTGLFSNLFGYLMHLKKLLYSENEN